MEINFDPYPYFWNLILPGISLLAVVMIWKELLSRQRQTLRLSMVILAIAALIVLASRPEYLHTLKAQTVVILTENFQKKRLDSLKKVLPQMQEFDLTGSGETLQKFVQNHSIEKAFVMGEGLENSDLKLLSKSNCFYLPSPEPNGIIDIQFGPLVRRGQFLSVRIKTKLDKNARMIITGPSGSMDSLLIEKGIGWNEFRFRENIGGNWSREVRLRDNSGILLDKGIIPYQVVEPTPLSILFLQGYPTFETRYLKNWIKGMHHRAIVRSKVSKNKYLTEFINEERRNIPAITEGFLATVDLVIVDQQGWDDLSSSEKEIVKNEIENNGLGIVFLLDENWDSFSNRPGSTISKIEFIKTNERSCDLILIENGTKFQTPLIPVKSAENDFGFDILKDSKGNTISFGYFNGLGRVGFSLLPQTYTLVLNGYGETYSEYWSEIFDTVCKKWGKSKTEIRSEELLRLNKEVRFKVLTTFKDTEVRVDSLVVGLRQDPFFEDTWTFNYWPDHPGWIRITLNDEWQNWDYVYPDDVFRNLEVSRKIKSNKERLSSSNERYPNTMKGWASIPPIYIFSIFITCMAILWIEPRI